MAKWDNIRYDEQSDVLYIHGRDGHAISEEISPGINVDIDQNSGEVLGIEILQASKALAPFLAHFTRSEATT